MIDEILTAASFLGVLAALAGITFVLAHAFELLRSLKPVKALGLDGVHPAFLLIFAILYATIALILFAGILFLIGGVIGLPFTERPDGTDPGEAFIFYVLRLAGLTTVLGAVIALPFTMVRLRLTHEQTTNSKDSLFNEKINAATQGLYARRQVTKWHRKKGHVDHWEDDIVQRNAAIDRLEGLAEENASEVPRIARLLSVYVRELSAEIPAKNAPPDATPNELRDWANSLPKLRSDMEKAAQTLGRLRALAEKPLDNAEVDLRGANLQRAALPELDFKMRF